MLGSQIANDDAELERLIWDLFLDFSSEMKLGEIFDPAMLLQAAAATGKQMPVLDEQKVVVIENEFAGDEFERAFQLSLVHTITPAGPTQSVQMALVRQGWKHYD